MFNLLIINLVWIFDPTRKDDQKVKHIKEKKIRYNPAWGYGVTPHPQAGIATSQMWLNSGIYDAESLISHGP